MKSNWSTIEQFRLTSGPYASAEGDDFGYFYIPRGKAQLGVMASSGDESIPWEHVSIKTRDFKGERTPTWEEMCWVKSLFWDAEECVVQYHPPESEYVNNHACVLHLWKPLGIEMPRPPSIAVGIK